MRYIYIKLRYEIIDTIVDNVRCKIAHMIIQLLIIGVVAVVAMSPSTGLTVMLHRSVMIQ